MIRIVWDNNKNHVNVRKHRIDFSEAKSIFDDSLQVSVNDPDHSSEERRYVTLGTSARNRLLIVAHTFDDDTIRIITARKPNRRERLNYEEGVYDA